MRRIGLAVLCLMFSISLGLAFWSTVNADTFNRNRIIDDALFDNASAMNATQIDSFLNSFPNSCISPNSGFRAIDPSGYSHSGGFTYGGFVTAGKVIFDSAQAYTINPQVLLVTLQKEQGLVVGGAGFCSNGDQNKYAAAVGYGCPDSGTVHSYTGVNLYQRSGVTVTSTGPTCVNSASKAGFSQQVIRGAWLLKFGEQRSKGNINWAVVKGSWNNSDDPQTCYGGPMTQGNYQVCPSGATTYYDGYYPIDGSSVHMDSGATAALYWYTPHFSGNQHFFDIFTGWFGSTLATPFFKVGSSPDVYVLGASNNYYHVINETQLRNYGYGTAFGTINTYGVSPLAGMTNSGNLPAVASFGDAAIYLFDAGGIRHFPDEDTFKAYGYSFSHVADLPNWIYGRVVRGASMQTIAKSAATSAVYLIQNGKKSHITSNQAFTTLGSPAYSSRPSVTFGSNYLNTLPSGPPIMTAGTFVKASDANRYGVWDGTGFQTMSAAAASDTGLLPNYSASTSILNQLPANTATFGKLAKDSGGTLYILDKAKKYTVAGGQLANLGFDNSDFILANDVFLAKFTTTAMKELIQVRGTPTVYQIISGEIYHIFSEDDLHGLGYSFGDILAVNHTTGNLFINNHAAVFKQGRLVRIGSAPSIYLIEGTFSKKYIPSSQILSEYGFRASDVVSVATSDLAPYSTSGNLAEVVKNGSSVYWLVNSGVKHKISATMLGSSYYNINTAGVQVLSDTAFARLPASGDLTQYIMAKDGSKIYGVSNGQKHWFTTSSSFLSHGGNWNNVIKLSAAYVNSLPSGTNIN